MSLSCAEDLAPADRDQLAAWWEAWQASPGVLPAELDTVHERLIRATGRGALPSGREVFVKFMRFPRHKDRWRYRFRPLPAVHEARLLRWLTAHGIHAPAVLAVAGRRRLGWPQAAALATGALPVTGEAVSPAQAAACLRALIDARVFHPDCHPGNFLVCTDGRVAILDMQSARIRPFRVTRFGQRQMIVKLLASVAGDLAPWVDALIAHGLATEATAPELRAAGAAERRRYFRDRIARCMEESSQFSVRRQRDGVVFTRREPPPAAEWVEGGEELVRYWIGDRVLETLDHRTPCLGALFRPSPWSSARHRLLVGGGASALAAQEAQLLAGHVRYVEILNSNS